MVRRPAALRSRATGTLRRDGDVHLLECLFSLALRALDGLRPAGRRCRDRGRGGRRCRHREHGRGRRPPAVGGAGHRATVRPQPAGHDPRRRRLGRGAAPHRRAGPSVPRPGARRRRQLRRPPCHRAARREHRRRRPRRAPAGRHRTEGRRSGDAPRHRNPRQRRRRGTGHACGVRNHPGEDPDDGDEIDDRSHLRRLRSAQPDHRAQSHGGRARSPTLGLDEPIDEVADFRIVRGAPAPADLALAQVNAFGFGGINAVALVAGGR